MSINPYELMQVADSAELDALAATTTTTEEVQVHSDDAPSASTALDALLKGAREARKDATAAAGASSFHSDATAGQPAAATPTNATRQVAVQASTLSTTPPVQVKAVPKLKLMSLRELAELDVPEMEFIVDGLLPRGDVVILAAPQKTGKSFLMMDLILSASQGKPFLGLKTNKCECVYLDLEERVVSMKKRLRKLQGDDTAPDGAYITNEAPTLGGGLLDALAAVLDERPGVKLIVIDVLAKIRDDNGKNQNAYSADYQMMTPLKDFAEHRNVCMILCHHLRKADATDVFDRVSGSTGLTGAADGTMIIEKRSRTDSQAVLSYVSRSVEGVQLRIEFDKESGRWHNLGDAEAYAEREMAQAYETSPIVRTIKELTHGKGFDGVTITPTELLAAGREITGSEIALSAASLTKKLNALKPMLENDGIGYKYERKSSARLLSFYRVEKEVDAEQECIDWADELDSD